MITILMILVIPYLAFGLFLARGIYSEQIRQIRAAAAPIVPPRPKRPEIRMNEFPHQSTPTAKCNALKNSGKACNCRYRDDWVRLKNEWRDYDEWQLEYRHLKNGVEKEPTPNMLMVYSAIPFWPLVMAGIFVKSGAKNIPDFREIERLEKINAIDKLELN